MPHTCQDEHCDHDHSDDLTPAQQSLLYSQIDFSSVRTLNEASPGSGRAVLQKPFADRLSDEPLLSSDADDQLLLHVPFAGQVRLHSLHVRSSPAATAPRTLKLYANMDDLDFDSVGDATPTQSFDLSQTSDVQDVPVKRALFNATRCLTLFVEDNFGDDVTEIGWIAFKGDFMRLNREPVEVLYEAAARPSDHKVEGTNAEVGGMGFGAGRRGWQGF